MPDRAMSIDLPMPISTVRLQEVAEAAGVSTVTVSRCMTNPERVSARTREHVLEVAARLGYIPNRQASSLASARTRVIGVVVPTSANPIHSMVMQGAADVLEPAGYQILLGHSHFSAEAECNLVRTFLGHRVDGILLTGKDHSADCVHLLERSGIPMVEMFDYNPHPLDMSVGSSNVDAGAAIGQYLIGKGRKNLAFVGHLGLDDSRMTDRLAGLVLATREGGLPDPVSFNIAAVPGTGQGGEIIGTILRQHPQIDAVVFAGHYVAMGAIRHAVDLHIDVPGRVAIASFGDTIMSGWIRPSLTTIRFPVRETGMEAGRMMLARLNKREPPAKAVRLGFEIVPRESA
ncbi:LacI family transcriptional regulator [Nostoc sp. 3335mG]|nr:LacI family transcriptional regulator [Nostoc sp. 3335mG]